MFSVSVSFSSSVGKKTIERVQTLTAEGMEFAYNLDFPHAQEKFNEAIVLEPLHPRPYVGKAFIQLWQYLLSNSEADYETFLAGAERAIDAAERYRDSYETDADILICLGTAYGQRAFAYGRAKSYLKSAWDGKKSYDYFADALQLDPKAHDAYTGLGVYHYFTAFLPKALKWMVSILGISADSELGIKELRVAAEKGRFTQVEAQYYLAQFLPWHDGDFESGEQILNDLMKRYPSNTLFIFTKAVWEIRRHDVHSAQERLAAAAKLDNQPLSGVLPYVHYKLAECLFRLCDFSAARLYYQQFVQTYHGETYLATAQYRIGITLEREGLRSEAIPHYKEAIQADRKFGDDFYSARRAERLLKTTLTSFDTLFMNAQNLLKSGEYRRAREQLSELLNRQDISNDQRAETLFSLGETLFELGSYTEALERFHTVVSTSIAREHQLLPWSHYQSGMCYLKLRQSDRARKEFEAVLRYDDYDFQNWLSFRAERELEKLKK